MWAGAKIPDKTRKKRAKRAKAKNFVSLPASFTVQLSSERISFLSLSFDNNFKYFSRLCGPQKRDKVLLLLLVQVLLLFFLSSSFLCVVVGIKKERERSQHR